jgi:DNA-directed RNA polymerase specialized sigma24 family protein
MMETDVRGLLVRCRSANAEQRALKRQMEYAMGDGGTVALAKYAERLRGLREQLDNDLDRAEAIISKLANARDRIILRYYYLLGWSDQRIADELYISVDHARHTRAQVVRGMDVRIDWGRKA